MFANSCCYFLLANILLAALCWANVLAKEAQNATGLAAKKSQSDKIYVIEIMALFFPLAALFFALCTLACALFPPSTTFCCSRESSAEMERRLTEKIRTVSERVDRMDDRATNRIYGVERRLQMERISDYQHFQQMQQHMEMRYYRQQPNLAAMMPNALILPLSAPVVRPPADPS